MIPNQDYYRILQIDPSAEQEVVQAAYRRLAMKYHPDTNKSPEANHRMLEINAAYEILGDPIKRERYDRWRQKEATTRRQSVSKGSQRTQSYPHETDNSSKQRERKYAERRSADERQQKERAEAQRRAEYERQLKELALRNQAEHDIRELRQKATKKTEAAKYTKSKSQMQLVIGFIAILMFIIQLDQIGFAGPFYTFLICITSFYFADKNAQIVKTLIQQRIDLEDEVNRKMADFKQAYGE